MKVFAMDPFYNEKQFPAFDLYPRFFPYFPFNGMRKYFLVILTAAGQNIPFLFAVIQLYCKQLAVLNYDRFCGSAYLP